MKHKVKGKVEGEESKVRVEAKFKGKSRLKTFFVYSIGEPGDKGKLVGSLYFPVKMQIPDKVIVKILDTEPAEEEGEDEE